MKNLGYALFKLWISAGLFCYYRKIQVGSLERVPKNVPVLFLSNHQNALMDVLLLATRCNRRPWFLTRSDVFANSFLNRVFGFLQMIPIYRIRDGKENLSKNHAIFERCSSLLVQKEAVLIFPEANHSLKRRVRPLSKGFTRIIDATLDTYHELPLYLVPVGQNYDKPTQIGDSTALCFGKPIIVTSDQHYDGKSLKEDIFNSLRQLTTHIHDEENYNAIIEQLDACNVDYLDPEVVNGQIQNLLSHAPEKTAKYRLKAFRFLFYLLNLPMVLLWRMLVKPKVPEPEFTATFRFGFSMLGYPIFYLILLAVLQYTWGCANAPLILLGHFVLNLILVKGFDITSSARRR